MLWRTYAEWNDNRTLVLLLGADCLRPYCRTIKIHAPDLCSSSLVACACHHFPEFCAAYILGRLEMGEDPSYML